MRGQELCVVFVDGHSLDYLRTRPETDQTEQQQEKTRSN